MRYVWLVFVGLLVAMAIVLPRLNRPARPTAVVSLTSKQPNAQVEEGVSSFASLREAPASSGPASRADSIVAFGLAQRGTPYVFAGTSPLTGFDCSGFIMYTFARFNVAVPHSTAMLIDVGRPVARMEAQPGDIVVFTGTSPASTAPGHAGIVVSGRGEVPLRFVHASSARRESGVKVSQVEGTDYERRFMQVRRVLGPGAPPASRPTPAAIARKAAPVAALPPQPVEIEPLATPAVALPKVLAPWKKAAPIARKSTHAVARKAVAGKKVIARKKAPTKKKAAPTLKHKAAATKAPAKKPARPTTRKRTTR